MNRKVRMGDRVLFAILLWCIFSFKLILIDVGESGIRADDFLIVLAALFMFFRGDLFRIRRSHPFNIYLGFVGVSLLSAVWNSAAGRVVPLVSLFFVARLAQYAVFYYFGYLVARGGFNLSRVLSLDLALLSVVFPLQAVGLFPLPSAFARPGGNTNGSYELAAVAAFLMCYLGYKEKKRVSGFLAFALIIATASRSTFIGSALSLATVATGRAKSIRTRIAVMISITVVGLTCYMAVLSMAGDPTQMKVSTIGRLSNVVSGFSLDIITDAYDNAPVYQNSTDYYNGQFFSAVDYSHAVEADTSGLQRLFRWTSLIKSTCSAADSIILGLGPSFGTEAVDGYIVRVFIETGLLGLFMFAWFAWALLFDSTDASWPFRQYVFILLVTACFIDIFTSYKPMLLLWLWHGMQQFQGKKVDHEDSLLHEG